MKRIISLTLIILSSCSPKLIPASVESTSSDTTVTTREIILHDTVFFAEVPQESKETVSADTSSVLETSIAKSQAKWQNGRLFHSLENKAGVLLSINVTIPETQVTTNRSQVLTRKETVIQKERYMAWWQKVFCWIGVAAVIFVVIRFVIWIHGGGMTSILKKFVNL